MGEKIQDRNYNRTAPSTYDKAMRSKQGSSAITRTGRSFRVECGAFLQLKYVNFNLPGLDNSMVKVRKQPGVSSDDAHEILRKICFTRVSGLYLIKSCLNHATCSRPISIKLSPERLAQMHEEISKMHKLGISNDKIALMLVTHYQQVGKTSQDVSNILQKLETRRLAEK